MNPIMKIKKLENFLGLPDIKSATKGSSGIDLMSASQEDIVISAWGTKLIPTGIALEIPEGYEGQVRSRSGLALKQQVFVLNSPGTIDSDYRGEVGIILANFSSKDFVVKRGDRVAQLVIAKYADNLIIEEANLSETERDQGGFGSTGV